jgi:hypothetical protein
MATMLTYVAGLGYRPGARERFASMLEGEECTLKAEPENVYDKNAVAVYDGAFKLGYIPAADARAVALALSRGLDVSAAVYRRTTEIGLAVNWQST